MNHSSTKKALSSRDEQVLTQFNRQKYFYTNKLIPKEIIVENVASQRGVQCVFKNI